MAGGFATNMTDALRGLLETLSEAARKMDATKPEGASGPHGFGTDKLSAVFGYTLRMGQDGVFAERFGDMPQAAGSQAAGRASPDPARAPAGSPVAPPAAPPAAPMVRQPITEIFEEDGAVIVVAELPGADPSRIVCRAEGARLLIEAPIGADETGRQYRKDLELPRAVRAEGMRRSFANGILELRLPLADTPT